MDTPEYDIVITGAGPVGSTLALLLAAKASRPGRIALIGKHFMRSPHKDATPDPRAIALNHGSRVLLEQLSAWPTVSNNIETVHVSQRGRLGRTLIRHDELGVPRLGSVVTYTDLLATLHGALACSGVTLIEAAHTTPLVARHVHMRAGDRDVSSALAIQSDGAPPKGLTRHYNQYAVLATVKASRARPRWAFERFTSQGPLALLPHPQGHAMYGVVWCCSPENAERLHKLDSNDFDTELHAMFGDRLGTFQSLKARHIFPLTFNAGPLRINARTVAIGNAAQTLHPVAGQGLNLGLRDAVQLSHALVPWLRNTHADPESLLRQFTQNRHTDRWLTAGITDFLPRVFSTQNPIIEHASGLGLLAMDLNRTLRAPLAHILLQGLRS